MKQTIRLIKFVGITLIISGILFFAHYLFVLPIFSFPLEDDALMTWLIDSQFSFVMADELLMFATLSLIPSIAAIYKILVKVDKIKTLLSCSLLAVVIPINVFLVIILGRLAYPVYDLVHSPAIYRFILSTYHGSLHCVAIILSIATIILCLVIRKSVIGKWIAYLGFVVGILEFISSYPWLIGSTVLIISQLFFSAWFVILGIRMLSRSKEVVASDCNN